MLEIKYVAVWFQYAFYFYDKNKGMNYDKIHVKDKICDRLGNLKTTNPNYLRLNVWNFIHF